MPAHCGPFGPMICLNGATCNETTGSCENCPYGFTNDLTLFRGNVNCGLNETGIYFIYLFTVVFAFTVSAVAAASAYPKKRAE